MTEPLQPCRIPVSAVWAALAEGGRDFRRHPGPAALFASVFAALGLGLFAVLAAHDLHALRLPLAGGFLLVGPALLAGFFAVRRVAATRPPRLADLVGGFAAAPRGVWALAAVCALLFLIWMSDAATVYSFMIGDTRPGADQVWRFHAWTSLMGGVFALIVFHITAFAVPLLLDRRATLVGAVVASVRGIWTNGPAMATWAGVLAAAIIATVFVPPLLGVSLPWLAFVSDLLYLRVYPSRPK